MMKLLINTLDNQWHDADEVILHAVMQILTDFVEKEQPDTLDFSGDQNYAHAWNVITEVYDWWKNGRIARHGPLDDLDLTDLDLNDISDDDRGLFSASNALRMRWYEEDTTMIQRVVSIRDYLWT
jgi:hypothetical protein